MAVSDDFLAFVLEQLTPFARVVSRRMFSGAGLYADGLFFGLIADDTLYLKVDDSNRADYLQRGCKPFQPFPGKSEYSMSYYDVPADVLDDGEDLSRWARKSLAVALTSANKKPKKKTRGTAKRKRSVPRRVK
ncbi:MAG TPA: TfoX/Sxy family protein [Steroidobacteraceae bacterium]|nr:TfoX/Sxy family protein [Steroidobacteraceae bacterium]